MKETMHPLPFIAVEFLVTSSSKRGMGDPGKVQKRETKRTKGLECFPYETKWLGLLQNRGKDVI